MIKKLISLFLTIILVVVLVIFIYSYVKYDNLRNENIDFRNKIAEIDKDIEEVTTDNDRLEKEILKLEEDNKDKISVYDSWVELKKELEQILAS